ncbi:hypothetical protein PMHK_03840 [Pseudomonas sp. MHK4]
MISVLSVCALFQWAWLLKVWARKGFMGGGADWAAAMADIPANARLAPARAKRRVVIVMRLIVQLLEGMNSVSRR